MHSSPHQESKFVKHTSCDECGSSDANAVYTDGHTYCFSCNSVTNGAMDTVKVEPPKAMGDLIPECDIKFVHLPARGINEETCKRYSYGVWQDKQVACYFDDDYELIGQKLRDANKNFTTRGSSWSKSPLFGQHLFKGGRRVTVCEGEIDTLTMAQLTELKWPVVGVPNGAQAAAKAIANNLEFLESFDEVVFMFDQDEAGRKAATQCAELLTPGKAKIANLPGKDANELHLAHKSDQVVHAMWNAKTHRPDEIAFSDKIYEAVTVKAESADAVPYPWPEWNEITHGIRRGEMVMFTAGTGIGKSTVLREIAYHVSREHKVAFIALEESLKESALHFMGIHVKKPLHLTGGEIDREIFNEVFGEERLVMYDHFGSIDTDHLMQKIQYLARSGYKYIFLDHITLMLSGNADVGDERRRIDAVMTKLRQAVAQLDIALLAVCHPRRGEGKPLEEGGQINLQLLRGSTQIAALSNIVIGLERNQQDSENANIVGCRCLKNRFSGDTGLMCHLKFDRDSMRFIPATPFKPEDDF